MHPASYWKLDKKLVMGEFAAQATDGVAQNDLYTNLYTQRLQRRLGLVLRAPTGRGRRCRFRCRTCPVRTPTSAPALDGA